jgi:HEAT repeat protein
LTFTVLTELGEKVTGTLPQYLKDSNTAVRKVAAASLAAQGTRRAVESLLEAANSEDSRVRLEVAKVLRELTAGPNIQPQEALDLAVRLCRDRNPEVRKAGLLALPMFRSLKAGAIAKELTKDQDPQIRQEADRILQEMPNIIE